MQSCYRWIKVERVRHIYSSVCISVLHAFQARFNLIAWQKSLSKELTGLKKVLLRSNSALLQQVEKKTHICVTMQTHIAGDLLLTICWHKLLLMVVLLCIQFFLCGKCISAMIWASVKFSSILNKFNSFPFLNEEILVTSYFKFTDWKRRPKSCHATSFPLRFSCVKRPTSHHH